MSDRGSRRGHDYPYSGYGRGDSSRGAYSAHSGDTSSSSSRRRSRSPARGSRYTDSSSSKSTGRHDRDEQGRHDSRGGSSRGQVDLPASPPIPEGGKALGPQQMTPRNQNGKKLLVKTNHFLIQSLPVKPLKIYQYSLRFKIPASSQRTGSAELTKPQLARAFMVMEAKNIFGEGFVFDNVSMGWCHRELMPVDTLQSSTFNMPGHTSERPNQITVDVRADGALDLSPMVTWLRAGNTGLASGNTAVSKVLKALNAIFRDYPANKKHWTTRPNSSAFFERAPGLVFDLPSTGGILEAIRGVYQAVSVGFGGNLCVNVDNSCSAFYVPGLSLLDIARTFAGIHPKDPLCNGRAAEQLRRASEKLTGLFFTVKHTRTRKEEEDSTLRNIPGLYDPKKMRVKALTKGDAVSTTFQLTNATTGEKSIISVAEYFKMRYQIRLKYPNLPLIHTARDGDIPMEVCFTPEGERYKEPLQGQETADFIKVCTSPAYVREDQIQQHLGRLQWHRQPLLNSMGISVQTDMLSVRALQLSAPIPQYRKGSDHQPPRAGSWNLRAKTFLSPSSFTSWGVLYFPTNRKLSQDEVLNFCRSFVKESMAYGLQTPSGPPVLLLGNPLGNVGTMCEDLSAKVCSAFNVSKPHLLLVFLHQGENPALYKMIKNVCEIQGVPSQVMLVEKSILSSRGQPQYIANVAMKVNAKLGGSNHFIQEEKLFKEPIMMIGADISHPSPAELRRVAPPPSFAAVVASYDRECVRYTGLTAAQATTEHIIMNMKPIVLELLDRFRKYHNGVLPKKIIYWRDGLAESQVPAFIDNEVKAFEAVRKEKGLDFKLTAFNCLKKHKTRFFPEEKGQSDKHGNVLPCTVVENSTLNNDFYTVTQAALQGCCVPTHYISVTDENDMSPTDIQRLVVNSCFAYQRATRSIKVVPAVYYAHQVADRAKMHLREEKGQTVLRDVGKDLMYTMYWQ